MSLEDIAVRIGGRLEKNGEQEQVILPCFNKVLVITKDRVQDDKGLELTRNEQTFVYIHMAQGGSAPPSGNMKSLKEFPNTISKIVSMKDHVEGPLKKQFSSALDRLARACEAFGGQSVKESFDSADLAYQFAAFPRVPVVLLFWDEKDGFEADAKLLFDETVIQHLDIESIMFLSEHLTKNLMEAL